MTRYPLAEQTARSMKLNLVPCTETRKLYGYTVWLLDRDAATANLDRAGIRGPAREAALAILEERAAAL
jgi:hypothetical protein